MGLGARRRAGQHERLDTICDAQAQDHELRKDGRSGFNLCHDPSTVAPFGLDEAIGQQPQRDHVAAAQEPRQRLLSID